ncbi:ribosome maturation factor RimM [Calothrix sp. UHCC 0171]|uniref:ribosome maturation factor RimM n=1 Tax=Calothrix sp. UHCC 0171 TaxID=3110245 RepID=UPI002B209006|nr:ribosome maturation factor RimM [Calothrix sp. UHCC 0171]MEA5573279.1 ribosome maturation factor RimM [Calothrix sp. UHCC 0171]
MKEKKETQEKAKQPGQAKKVNQQKSSSPTLPLSPSPSLPTPIPDGYLEIGTIVAPQGLNGEMRVYPDTDFPERFEVPGMRWLLPPHTSQPQEIELISGRYVEGKNIYIIELEGVKNRNQAEEMRGCKMLVLESDRPHLEEGEYHILDLVGLQVFIQESGECIGTVVNLIPAGNDLLEVKLHATSDKKKAKNLLIPFVKEIVPVVDIAAAKVEITPPEGLLEIND